jgi:hypothetical protein
MADKKISALTAASTPLAGTEVLPIVQSGATVQVSVANLTAGRAISATAVTASTGDVTSTAGNFVPSTAAKGVNYTANTPQAGMTSQNLTWYEEGTWTPNQGAGLTVIGAFSSTGVYTRIGSSVTVNFSVSGATSVAVGSLGVITSNLPFTVSSVVSAVGTITTLTITSSAYANSTTKSVFNSGSAIAATGTIWVTVTYCV